ncbi:hypothetical protein T4D_3308 [Trichinella pseudospiralis]|uniref:Uncharacterized protein n=1 Tax=Trichinella pseudospiralis TaxID=6337 RepID=A0A0V1F3V1_TRIPS|nr:hypothetical protein T4D_2430 [Trichinella pseudospiralis]KRY92984.1 hypothetical protein T4D_3308 [Trichinella pseudospiralis]
MYQTLHRTEQRKHDAASTKKICEERAILHITAGGVRQGKSPYSGASMVEDNGDEILKNILFSGKRNAAYALLSCMSASSQRIIPLKKENSEIACYLRWL